MSAAEIELARRRLRERVAALLAPGELATYDAYHERVRAALDRGDLNSLLNICLGWPR